MVNFANREALQAYRTDLDTEQAVGRKLISLCSGSGCGAYGTASVQQTLKEELGKNGLADEFEVWVPTRTSTRPTSITIWPWADTGLSKKPCST
jgi:hypothetical protein